MSTVLCVSGLGFREVVNLQSFSFSLIVCYDSSPVTLVLLVLYYHRLSVCSFPMVFPTSLVVTV